MKKANDILGWIAQCRVDSPLGPLVLVASAQGLGGLWFDDQAHHPGELDAPSTPKNTDLIAARRWLDDYWQRGASSQALRLAPRGTPFQQAVWKALRHVGPNEPSTYGAIAREVGSPKGSRAVGAAVGRNPLGIIVPCHRILGQDGSLTGYAGGLPRKQWLLRHEAQCHPLIGLLEPNSRMSPA